jgi:hypothetical protein
MLYGFVIVRIDRRDLVGINVTTKPTAEWIARRISEAFPGTPLGRAGAEQILAGGNAPF